MTLPPIEAFDAVPVEGVLSYVAALQARVASRIAQASKPAVDTDVMLTAAQVAKELGVTPDWVWRRADTLPFRRVIGPRCIRYSQRGLRRYVESRRA